MAQNLYTPFLTQAGRSIGQGLQRRSQKQEQMRMNKLFTSAYMDEPGAMPALMKENPQLAMQITEKKREEKQRQRDKETKLAKDDLQNRLAIEEAGRKSSDDLVKQDALDRKTSIENSEMINGFVKEAINLGSYESANNFINEKISQNKATLGELKSPLTPELYKNLVEIEKKKAIKEAKPASRASSTAISKEARLQKSEMRAIYMENKELIDDAVDKGLNLGSYPKFSSFMSRFVEDNKDILKDTVSGISEEKYNDLVAIKKQEKEDNKKLEGPDIVKTSVDIPGEGTKKIRKYGKVEFEEASIEEKQAFIRSNEAKIKQAETKAERVEAAKLSAKARQDLKNTVNTAAFRAREQSPRLNNLRDLAKEVDSGSFAETKLKIKRFFKADVASEEEFIAETNRIILDAATYLKGALSQRENMYLENVSPYIGKSMKGNLRIIENIITMNDNAIGRQDALKKFKGDPVDFNYVGKNFNTRFEKELFGSKWSVQFEGKNFTFPDKASYENYLASQK
jgi:hypothetical protein